MSELEHPTPLAPDLAVFLRDKSFACLLYPTDHGTVFLAKIPGADIESVRGTVPIGLRHELFDRPTAPVIRMVLTIYDQPAQPLALECFVNVEDPEQRSDYVALAHQEEMLLLFYDEHLTHRLTKGMSNLDTDAAREILDRADKLFHAIPEDQFSFEVAKAWVMDHTLL